MALLAIVALLASAGVVQSHQTQAFLILRVGVPYVHLLSRVHRIRFIGDFGYTVYNIELLSIRVAPECRATYLSGSCFLGSVTGHEQGSYHT